MDLEAGDVCDFTYTPSGYDAALYILTDCSDMESCVVGAESWRRSPVLRHGSNLTEWEEC